MGSARPRLLGCAAMALAVFFAGCASAGLDSVMDTLSGKSAFRKAVEKGDWTTANKLYGADGGKFDRDEPLVVAQAVRDLNARWAESLGQARAELQRIYAEQDSMAKSLDVVARDARQTLESYHAMPLVREHSNQLRDAFEVEDLLNDGKVRPFLSARFARYDHVGMPLFFDDLTALAHRELRDAVVRDQRDTVSRAIRLAPQVKAAQLLQAYSSSFDPETRKTLETAYAEQAAGIRSGAPVTFNQMLRLSKLQRASGFGNDPVKVARLDAAGATRLRATLAFAMADELMAA